MNTKAIYGLGTLALLLITFSLASGAVSYPLESTTGFLPTGYQLNPVNDIRPQWAADPSSATNWQAVADQCLPGKICLSIEDKTYVEARAIGKYTDTYLFGMPKNNTATIVDVCVSSAKPKDKRNATLTLELATGDGKKFTSTGINVEAPNYDYNGNLACYRFSPGVVLKPPYVLSVSKAGAGAAVRIFNVALYTV